MAISRRSVEEFAESHQIELEITVFPRSYANHEQTPSGFGVHQSSGLVHGRPGINHVHAYTKGREVFGSSDLHNISLWDEDCAAAVDWSVVMADLCDHMPVPCPFCIENGGTGCEVCDEEDVGMEEPLLVAYEGPDGVSYGEE